VVDYIKDNFAIWAKYYNRPIGEGWERFAERTVGVDDNGNVVYKNNESAQVEDGGGDGRELYQYDNTFGGIVFGDTGVKTRISVDEWYNLESYDGDDSRTILSYAGTPGDDEVPYYDTGDGEWKLGALGGLHDHDDDYVNTAGADQMEGPLDITVGGLSVAAGLTVVSLGLSVTGGGQILTGDFTITLGDFYTSVGDIVATLGDIYALDGDISFGYGNMLYSRNLANDDNVELIQVVTGDKIQLGDTSYLLKLQADTTSHLITIAHDATEGYVAPFFALDSWTDGYIPQWTAATMDFAELDPASFAWDRTLDLNEYIQGYDGGADRNLVGMSSTGPTATFGSTSTDSVVTGKDVRLISSGVAGDIELTSSDNIYFTCDDYVFFDCQGGSVYFDNCSLVYRENPGYIYMWLSSSASFVALYIDGSDNFNVGDSTVTKINLRGAASRPQYNAADLALLSDVGGGPGSDTDAIHLSETDEFAEVASVTPAAADRIIFEDATDSWDKKYNTIANLLGVQHDHTESDITDLGNYTVVGHTHVEANITDLDHNDTDAIHDNVSSEISALSGLTPAGSDVLIIEDANLSYAKRKITMENISDYVQGDMGGPYLPLTAGSGDPLSGDLFCDEDIELDNNKQIRFALNGGGTQQALFMNTSNVLVVGVFNTAMNLIGAMPYTDGLSAFDVGGNPRNVANSTTSARMVYGDTALRTTFDTDTDFDFDGAGKTIRCEGSGGFQDMCWVSGASTRIFGNTTNATWLEGSPLKLFTYGYSGTASPSTSQWGTAGSWGIHIDTDGGAGQVVFLVYNHGGTLYKVALT